MGKALKANVGVEANMLDNRLSFVVDFFLTISVKVFFNGGKLSPPAMWGLVYTARPYGNVGSMRSYGTDGNISYTHEIRKDWSFTIRGGNYTYSANEIINWEQALQDIHTNYITVTLYQHCAVTLPRDCLPTKTILHLALLSLSEASK